MSVSLTLDQMTIEEKLQTMEMLWDDLRGRAESVISPDWHQEALAEREASIETGEDTFTDWDRAKQDIRSQLK